MCTLGSRYNSRSRVSLPVHLFVSMYKSQRPVAYLAPDWPLTALVDLVAVVAAVVDTVADFAFVEYTV